MPKFKSEELAVLCLHSSRYREAQSLAHKLGIDFCEMEESNYQAYVVVAQDYIGLRSTLVESGTDLVVDFVGGAVGHRRQQGEGKNQPIAKAIGVRSDYHPRVLDLTAGLGRDAFVLASLGCELSLVERSPFIFAILEDGLKRAMQDEQTRPIVERMRWMNRQALEYLGQLKDDLPDVIYLDPMYPHRQKSALVKKEMRIIRTFVGEDEDLLEVLTAARRKALKRVVVKRPKTATPCYPEQVNFTVESKNTRYDVYLPTSD